VEVIIPSQGVKRYSQTLRQQRERNLPTEHSKNTMLCSGLRKRQRPKRKEQSPNANVGTVVVRGILVEIAKSCKRIVSFLFKPTEHGENYTQITPKSLAMHQHVL
jgi:hypothetical protein